METFWIATGALATAAMAVATAVLAWQNRGVLTNTQSEATATRDMVNEVRRDRQLNSQPYLALGAIEELPDDGSADYVWIKNVGPGAAINCVYLRGGRDTAPHRSDVFALGAGAAEKIGATGVNVSFADYMIQDAAGRSRGRHIAIYCQDAQGAATFRFVPPLPKPEVWPRHEGGTGTRPRWLDDYARMVGLDHNTEV